MTTLYIAHGFLRYPRHTATNTTSLSSHWYMSDPSISSHDSLPVFGGLVQKERRGREEERERKLLPKVGLFFCSEGYKACNRVCRKKVSRNWANWRQCAVDFLEHILGRREVKKGKETLSQHSLLQAFPLHTPHTTPCGGQTKNNPRRVNPISRDQ